MKIDVFKQAALEQCHRSKYKNRMGAVVVHRGKIVGKGFNKVHSTGIPFVDGKHAEIEALNNTTAKYRKDSTVYVCRITKDEVIALARPCHACIKTMRKMGVKYVCYSHVNGWTKENIGDM